VTELHQLLYEIMMVMIRMMMIIIIIIIIQEFMYRDTTNVVPEMYDYTSNNWSHWNSNEKLK
jgi:hypothetical protein